MRSSKWHALGNVYLLVESDVSPDLVRSHVGESDGIVEVVEAAGNWAEVRIWNPDGSQAEMSGNGTRIAAAWLIERTGAGNVRIRVGAREVTVRALPSGLLEQDLGPVEVGEQERVGGIELTPVTVGNPHAVVRGEPDEISTIGPRLETHPRFPQRTNVQVVRLEQPGEATARVWERGVGETTASGSSAVAVAAATHGEGDVLVHFPGGDLEVRIRDGRATLIGPAEPVPE
jgi:diaminopimelate epimerase